MVAVGLTLVVSMMELQPSAAVVSVTHPHPFHPTAMMAAMMAMATLVDVSSQKK
jgi:hypothetical protein